MKSMLRLAIVAACLAGLPAWTAPAQLPEFPRSGSEAWLNSGPLTRDALRGHPVLVEFWTFDCSNCRATMPWMREIFARYASQGLVVVSVHTPETPGERDPSSVRAAVRSLGIRYPVLLDPDATYWREMGNHYWPALYLFDAEGRLVKAVAGEVHVADATDESLERSIHAALEARSAHPMGR